MALLWALPAQADGDLRAVLQQVREQLKQDQLEIRDLRNELAEVRKRGDTPALIPRAGLPPREARNVVVTHQPGNLPGRSVGPPGTASGVGTPGAPQPEPAAAISSAHRTIKVSLSGQVDRALLYGDDGKSNAFRNVDNIISSTRFRMVGEGRVSPETTWATNLEREIRPNLSNNQPLVQTQPQAAGNVF